MRLTVKISHIPRLERLIENNKFLEKVLKADAYGGWTVESTHDRELKEIKRLLCSHSINYKIE